MQAAPCAWGASIHAASLLTSLNVQREQGQFCDVVLRPKQDPGELYPAHRCVLAASSPVLASILSSTGALVELQAPCLSDSVLPLLLDFIYTGDLPYSRSQHQYHNLLTAACYLQMDVLQEALKARQQTEAEAGDNANVSTGTLIKYLPLSLEPEDHPYSANVGTCNDIDPCRIEVLGESGDDKEVQKDQFHSGHSAGSVKPKPWHGSTDGELESTVEDRRRSNKLCTSEEKEEETRQRFALTVLLIILFLITISMLWMCACYPSQQSSSYAPAGRRGTNAPLPSSIPGLSRLQQGPLLSVRKLRQ
ncbi:hypothetical protein NQZ68_017622 [Dissostichus eleginoides]|nr:hypothetical protein NQZ68_017622 [Dissostichus eleginoides]